MDTKNQKVKIIISPPLGILAQSFSDLTCFTSFFYYQKM